jgi:hypothetical protein
VSTPRSSTILYPMTPAAFACFRRYSDLNAVSSVRTELELSPQVRDLLGAAHHILGGGRVAIRVVTPGRPEIVEELDACARTAVEQANAITRENGVYMTIQG